MALGVVGEARETEGGAEGGAVKVGLGYVDTTTTGCEEDRVMVFGSLACGCVLTGPGNRSGLKKNGMGSVRLRLGHGHGGPRGDQAARSALAASAAVRLYRTGLG